MFSLMRKTKACMFEQVIAGLRPPLDGDSIPVSDAEDA